MNISVLTLIIFTSFTSFTSFTNGFNYFDKIHDGLYMCNTYCFTYNQEKLSLDNSLCDNVYAMSSINHNVKPRDIYIANTSCNKLYKMSFNDKIYRYTNPPYIENFCNANNIRLYCGGQSPLKGVYPLFIGF